MCLSHSLMVNAMTTDGGSGPRASATWAWPREVFARRDVERLAESWIAYLSALCTHAERPEAVGRTPSDLSLVKLTQNQISQLEQKWRTMR